MSRKPYQWTTAQKAMVKQLRRQGASNAEIAKKLGCPQSTLLWFIREGRLGHIPKRQGQHRGRKNTAPDSEKSGCLFGTTSWKKRQIEIRDGWSEEEARRRQDGDLPCVSDNYHRFKKRQ